MVLARFLIHNSSSLHVTMSLKRGETLVSLAGAYAEAKQQLEIARISLDDALQRQQRDPNSDISSEIEQYEFAHKLMERLGQALEGETTGDAFDATSPYLAELVGELLRANKQQSVALKELKVSQEIEGKKQKRLSWIQGFAFLIIGWLLGIISSPQLLTSLLNHR